MSARSDRLAEVLRTHQVMPHGTGWRCVYPCGWRSDTREDHTAHVVEQIEAVIQIPDCDAVYRGQLCSLLKDHPGDHDWLEWNKEDW